MARMENLIESEQAHMRNLPLPTFETTPWAEGPPLSERRVAIVTTAGLGLRGEDAFGIGAADYKVIPAETDSADILMTHISVKCSLKVRASPVLIYFTGLHIKVKNQLLKK